MDGIDFVVAIGADQQEVLQIRPGQEILEQIERRRVEPLQVVEEERQRVFRPGEDAEEAPKHQLETRLCLLRFELGNRRLVADDELELGDNIDHEPTVRAQRLQKGVAPAAKLGVALPEERPNKAVKGVRQSGVRDVALVLVELA